MGPMKSTVLSLKNMKANYKIKRTFIRISRSPFPAGFFFAKRKGRYVLTDEKGTVLDIVKVENDRVAFSERTINRIANNKDPSC